MSIVLGIDIGGSGIKGAPVDTATGQLVGERLRIATPAGARPDDVKAVVKQIVEHFGHAGPVGITFPGIVQGGVTLSAANVDDAWLGLDADALFTRETGRDVHLLNDADAAGLAEMRFGAGVDRPGTVLMLTFGTGIGSALFRDGQLVPNTELGHLWLREKHAEAWASAAVRERENLGWKAWTRRVSAYLEHLELLFSPDLFIIGGGISKKADKWRDLVVLERSRLVPAALQNDAGIVGAAMYAAGHAAVRGSSAGQNATGLPPRPQRVASSATRPAAPEAASAVVPATTHAVAPAERPSREAKPRIPKKAVNAKAAPAPAAEIMVPRVTPARTTAGRTVAGKSASSVKPSGKRTAAGAKPARKTTPK